MKIVGGMDSLKRIDPESDLGMGIWVVTERWIQSDGLGVGWLIGQYKSLGLDEEQAHALTDAAIGTGIIYMINSVDFL